MLYSHLVISQELNSLGSGLKLPCPSHSRMCQVLPSRV